MAGLRWVSEDDRRKMGPHFDRAAGIGVFVDLRRRRSDSRQIGTIVAPTAKRPIIRKSRFTGPVKGCLFFGT